MTITGEKMPRETGRKRVQEVAEVDVWKMPWAKEGPEQKFVVGSVDGSHVLVGTHIRTAPVTDKERAIKLVGDNLGRFETTVKGRRVFHYFVNASRDEKLLFDHLVNEEQPPIKLSDSQLQELVDEALKHTLKQQVRANVEREIEVFGHNGKQYVIGVSGKDVSVLGEHVDTKIIPLDLKYLRKNSEHSIIQEVYGEGNKAVYEFKPPDVAGLTKRQMALIAAKFNVTRLTH